MRALRLAAFEFRRQKTALQRLAVAFLVLIPLLYGALYLWSNWDPYGRTDRVPVAVVNNDRPVEVDGATVHAGRRFTDALRRQRTFDWHFTDAGDAGSGLAEGRYYLVITVPPDFSADLTSGAGATPRRAEIGMRVDDGNGYLFNIMARAVRTEITRQVDEAAVTAYFESVYGELDRFRAGLADARDGAGELRDGLAQQQEGASRLVADLERLQGGSTQLTSGAEQVASGNRDLADMAVPVLNQLSDVLPGFAGRTAAVTDSAAVMTGLVNEGADTLTGRQQRVEAAVSELGRAHPELRADPAYRQLRVRSSAVTDRVDSVSLATARVNADAQRLSGSAQSLAAQVPRLQGMLGRAASDVERLADGAEEVADGAQRLDSGLGDSVAGAGRLESRLESLHSGANELTAGLTGAVDRLPSLSPQERERNAQILASPATVTFTADHPARVYGRGLAPFFFAIVLWVFGIAAFLVLRPINGRLLAARAGNLTVALAGWLPVLSVGLLGGLVLLGVGEVALGLDTVHTGWTVGLIALAAAAFTAIAHLLRVALGTIGSAIALVLLILQLTSCAGLYPVETLPAFFRVLHPYLPMTYLVDGLRVTMTGGNLEHLIRDVVILGSVAAVAFACTVAVVASHRVWTVRRLHPILQP